MVWEFGEEWRGGLWKNEIKGKKNRKSLKKIEIIFLVNDKRIFMLNALLIL